MLHRVMLGKLNPHTTSPRMQYLCATNVRNYGRRYLPDIYKWVTHEKGILGSQARQSCEI